jgi:glycosyltransferase involved in cell wall biosynthesis
MSLDQKRFWYDPVVGWAALNQSKVIICGNESTLEILRKRTANRVKIALIPTCIDTKFFYPKSSQVKHEPNTDVLFVARLTTFKDPITPIRAMKIVAKVKPETKLKIVGGGPLAKKTRLMVEELGLEKNVIIVGERLETRQFYQESGIFLAVSPVENFLSNSLLEAMASGLAIIATDVGETRNIIRDGKNGILIPPRDPCALAGAILSILSDQSFQHDLSRNALITAKEYDIETLGPKYVRLYKEVLSEV